MSIVACETERQMTWSRLEGLLFHWAVSQKAGAKWELPPRGFKTLPENTVDAGGAWQSQFEKHPLPQPEGVVGPEPMYTMMLIVPLEGSLATGQWCPLLLSVRLCLWGGCLGEKGGWGWLPAWGVLQVAKLECKRSKISALEGFASCVLSSQQTYAHCSVTPPTMKSHKSMSCVAKVRTQSVHLHATKQCL